MRQHETLVSINITPFHSFLVSIYIHAYICIYIIIGQDKTQLLYTTPSFMRQQSSDIYVYLSKKKQSWYLGQ